MTGWRNTSDSGEQLTFLENMADLAVFFLLGDLTVIFAIAFSYN